MKLHAIAPGLYQRGEFTNFNLKVRLAKLEAAGVTTVVNLCQLHRDDDLARYLEVINFPLPDNSQFIHQIDEITTFASELAGRIERREAVVVVHCHAGRNRSGLVNALILRDLYGLTGAEALRVLRERKSGAVANKFFERWLLELPRAATQRLVLWDLDGTLLVDNIYAPQAGALTDAVDEVFGVSGAAEAEVDWVGKTDLQLAREITALLTGDPERFPAERDVYQARYEELFLARCPESLRDRVTEGIPGALRKLGRTHALRIVSGNTRPVGTEKLRRAGLDRHFDLDGSAFGDDAELRADLVAHARAGNRGDVVLVGDTHRDIAAAHANGVPCVALATPKHGPEELEEAECVAASAAELPEGVAALANQPAAV